VLFIPKYLAKLSALTAPGGARPGMGGLRVLDLGEDWFRVEVTDGRRLAIVQAPSRMEPATAQTLEEGAADLDEVGEGIVPTADWQRAMRLGLKHHPLGVALGEGKIVLASGWQSVRTQALEGRFPDFDAVLPRTTPLFQVHLDAGLLAEICAVVSALARPAGATPRLALAYYGPEKPVGLMAQGEEGLTFDALLMPLS
jgi:hypothetical protein